MERSYRRRPAGRRSLSRSLGNSLLGSLLNQVMAIALLLLVFAGMWLHETYAVPVWLLVAAGIGAAVGVQIIQRRTFRSLMFGKLRRRTLR